MQIDVISRTAREAQVARAAGLPKTYIQIEGKCEELDEPVNFIREAGRVITLGKLIGRKPSVTALKAIGLMTAMTLRAKALGGWSQTGNYDPVYDLQRLAGLARSKLGPVRGANHPVSQFRECLALTLRDLDAVEPGA